MLNRKIISFTTLGALVFFGLYYTIAPRYLPEKNLSLNATILKPNQPLADFNLTDTNGKSFSVTNLKGHWTLLLFGYMGCPDVCPKTLDLLAQTWQIFEQKKYYPVNFVFASINSEIPKQQDLNDYVNHYNSRFLGIFGPGDKMAALTTPLGIYAKRQGQIIDHTASLILIDPQGRLKAIITPPFAATTLAHDLEILTK